MLLLVRGNLQLSAFLKSPGDKYRCPSSFLPSRPRLCRGSLRPHPARQVGASRTVAHCTSRLGCSLTQVLSKLTPTEAPGWTLAGGLPSLPERRVSLTSSSPFTRRLALLQVLEIMTRLGGLEKSFAFGSFRIGCRAENKVG